MKKSVIILDPGYEHLESHHHTVNQAIVSANRRHGGETVIFGGKNLASNIHESYQNQQGSIKAYFESPCYPANPQNLKTSEYTQLWKCFETEIDKLISSGSISKNNDLIIHTCYPFFLYGFARSIFKQKNKISGTILISTMFHPGAKPDGNTIHYFNRLENIRYKYSFKLLHLSAQSADIAIKIATPSKSYQQVYQVVWPYTPISVHPSICYRDTSITRSDAAPNKHNVLLYLGGPKSDKGFFFTIAWAKKALHEHPDINFFFHFNNDFPGAEHFLNAINELEESSKTTNNLKILRGNLSTEDYDYLISICNIICLLYDPDEYFFKTSGVLWDSLRALDGKRFLVTDNTWITSELEELGVKHRSTRYGNTYELSKSFEQLLHDQANHTQHIDQHYNRLLMSDFGEWAVEELAEKKNLPTTLITNSKRPQTAKLRILVVRTEYSHFSPLSGPAGFIPFLKQSGYSVDELAIPLGKEIVNLSDTSLAGHFQWASQHHLKSYQVNACIAESNLISHLHDYDTIHFLDGEHAGLLTAIYTQLETLQHKPKLICTFHQPAFILEDIIINCDYLKAFDSLHLMSPCQQAFFDQVLPSSKKVIIPHGVSAELIKEVLPAEFRGESASIDLSHLVDKKIVLTVGNWLRDYDAMIETSKLVDDEDKRIVFVVVSKGLDLGAPGKNFKNIVLLNQGISDEELHNLYMSASLMFLPLQGGAANNAILEAIAHRLPIVTTDLVSTRFYTDGIATFSQPNAESYANAILTTIQNTELLNLQRGQLEQRASELLWENITQDMIESLYQADN